jgi:hypothetical protein
MSCNMAQAFRLGMMCDAGGAGQRTSIQRGVGACRAVAEEACATLEALYETWRDMAS